MGFDGGSRPGEGGGAAAHVVDEDGVVLWAARRYIAGRATNQLAESEACNMGARKAVELARARGAACLGGAHTTLCGGDTSTDVCVRVCNLPAASWRVGTLSG